MKPALRVALIVAAVAAAAYAARRAGLARRPGVEGMDDAAEVEFYSRRIRLIHFLTRRHVLAKLRQSPPSGVLLDAGCGPGYLMADILNEFPNLRAIGLDISHEMLSLARRKLAGYGLDEKADLVLGDVHCLPLPDGSLDYLVTSFSLHHWRAPTRGLKEVHRVLGPGGRLVLFDLRRDDPAWAYWLAGAGEAIFVPAELRKFDGLVSSMRAAYTPREVEQLLAGAGFAERQVEHGLVWQIATARKK